MSRVNPVEVKVMNRFSVEEHCLENSGVTDCAIISIIDPDGFGTCFHGSNPVLRSWFWDETLDAHGCISEQQAKEIAEFVFENADSVDYFVVHCEAGKCRSAGVGAAILKYFNGDDSQIFGNRFYVPNTTCYRRALNALHEKGEKV